MQVHDHVLRRIAARGKRLNRNKILSVNIVDTWRVSRSCIAYGLQTLDICLPCLCTLYLAGLSH